MLRALVLVALWGSVLAAGSGWTPTRWFTEAKSPRVANYRIEAALDWPGKTLQGNLTLSWRNTGTAPTAELPLHLYLNAFKGPGSIYLREQGGRLPGPRSREDEAGSWGYCRLLAVSLDGAKLDGHPGEDETVHWVKLPRAVAPGETVRLEVVWETRFPRVVDRSGWGGAFLMAAQWYPKAGVYQGDRWICAPQHARTEYFADFGVYEVSLSLPNNLRPAYTGTPVPHRGEDGRMYDASEDPKRPGHHLWRLHAEDVHDFAWAVMPKLSWTHRSWTYRGVEVHYYLEGSRLDALPRQRAALEAALRAAGEWYFPYPYPVLTVVDVPDEARAAGGMEYPTLFTAHLPAFEPLGQRMLELVTVHEFGHQYFHGMLASNEVDEPWLDEGFASWFAHRVLSRNYQAAFGSRRFQVGTAAGEWIGHWAAPSTDPITRKGHETLDAASYNRAAYAKPTLVLDQLEASLGRPLMDRVLAAYTQEMAFKHPTRQDFRRIAERVSGRDLGAFWRDFVEGTEVLDIVIDRVNQAPVRTGGWMEGPQGMTFVPPQQVAPGATGSITLRRKGGISVPVTLWVRLENRREHRLTWDGKDRWVTFDDPALFDAPIQAAILDPDGNYPLLKDRLHAHWVARPARRGFHYWAQMAWGALTGLLQAAGLG